MLSHKSIIKLRYEIIKDLISICNEDEPRHIKLNVSDQLLDKILFEQKDDHKELAIPNELLKTIDLKDVNWKDVDIQGIDFSGTLNVELCAQLVYKQSLNNAILRDASLRNHFTEFEGISVKGTDFTDAKKLFSSMDINPQLVVDKDISYTKLKGMRITKRLDDVLVVGTDFTGATSNLHYPYEVYLNPQKVKNKDLTKTILNGVVLEEPITNECKILGANFTGSKNGILYYDSEEELEYYRKNGTILNDLELVSEYDIVLGEVKESFKVKEKTI